MAYLELAIDIGTSKTSIFEKGSGLVLSEPSVVAINQGKNAGLKNTGDAAKQMIGKSYPNTKINFPVFEGLIILPYVTSLMLGHFLTKLTTSSLFLRPKIRALITTPCGATNKDKKIFETVANEAGIKEAIIVEAPKAVRLSVPVSEKLPALIIDIGGGKTDIAVVANGDIIQGCSLGIGGNNMDTGIIDYLSDEYKFKIGLLTAEKIRIQIASLFENDGSALTVNGKDTIKGIPCSKEINSFDIYNTVLFYYQKIAQLTLSLIESLDTHTREDVLAGGAYVTGGAAQIVGLKEFFKDYLKMPIKIIEDANYGVVNGAGKAISDKSLLKKLLEKI